MHCHPWNTPPYEERLNNYNSMLCNLPATLQFEKLQRLHEAIQNNFEITPIAFRSGRWGFDQEVAKNIVRLGYRIGTSITPYTSWVRDGPRFLTVFSTALRGHVSPVAGYSGTSLWTAGNDGYLTVSLKPVRGCPRSRKTPLRSSSRGILRNCASSKGMAISGNGNSGPDDSTGSADDESGV